MVPEYDGLLALDRMERAVEKVRDRLLRSTAALEAADVLYAVIDGNAVMAWVEQVDESAVRFTQDVDSCCAARTSAARPRLWQRPALSTGVSLASTCSSTGPAPARAMRST